MPPSKKGARKQLEKDAKQLGLELIPGEDIWELSDRVTQAWAENGWGDDETEGEDDE
jgi:hypothetical protein